MTTPKTPAPNGMRLPLVTARTVSASWAAQYLDMSVNSIYKLIDEGKLKAYRHGDRGWFKILTTSVFDYETGMQKQLGIEPAKNTPN
ncbi:MAG TPA: helix-turn-helix domain-containing protein [Candidatus Angelobacter sp.]|nr:helix-turn-helix domain-containing protein [Candidatus Angelobacter sp.]